MKKNKMMRLASVLMVAVMLTTSVISGTYAKYTTKGSASDTARVAKWGVEVTTGGFLFKEDYAKHDKDVAANTMTVVSVNDATLDSVVAPGTDNTEGITFSIKGKPEVMADVKITVTGTENDTAPVDIFLGVGEYLDYTTAETTTTTGGVPVTTLVDDKFTVENQNYYPVLFTLTQTKTDETTATKLVTDGTLADVKAKLENLTKDYAEATPNNELEDTFGTFNLTWRWPFENVNDKADTFLGNLAAKTATTQNSYSLNTNVKIVIEVTQVD